jgi:hypothetical protein
MAVDPTNASNLSSGSVPLAQLGNAPATDVTGINDDIALLGFKVAANGSLSKYNLVDQTIDAFEDDSGIDGSASTNDNRNAANNYYSGGVTGDGTGGTITTYSSGGNDYKVHSFLSGTTNFVTLGPGSVDILLVAGGGGGGGTGGGGGGGGVIVQSGRSIGAGTFAVVVGGGGTGGGYPSDGTTGSDTTFDSTTLVAKGGGAGKHANQGGSGGSGGGSGYNSGTGGTDTQSSQSGDSGTYGFGNDGAGGAAHNGYPGGGGGGAGSAGSVPSNGRGGDGGGGKSNDYRTGSNVTYAAGGGGGGRNVSGPGGSAGGTNTGNGGGGGAGGGTVTGYDGGSGIAVIRYIEGAFVAYNDMTLVSNATTAESAPTKGDIVLTYTNGAGTATLNTDLTAEYSADNGSTWTSMSLTKQGTTGGHEIVTAHNVTLTSTSGTAMRYRIKTLNQSASKSTNIQAVSLGWS